ncbi:MAG TPA: PD-(D/E)XK nuclease family protein, partial [Luteitalea sp.]|nr:PD-(D/E)XK nuclease family protein [Luteitalea sp.]
DEPMLALPLVLVDPPLTSRCDVELARALLGRSRAPLLVAPDGDPWIARLLGAQASIDAGSSTDVIDTPAALRRVHDGLFSSSTATPRIEAADDRSVECLSAPGEARESVEVVRVLLSHAEQGVPFDRMAVALRAPELYASHLESALRRAQVPAHFARGTRRPDPGGRALLALLASAVENLSARRFAEYLSLDQVPRESSPSSTAPAPPETDQSPRRRDGLGDEAEALGLRPADAAALDDRKAESEDDDGVQIATTRSPWRWEALLNDAQVISGADRWSRRLRGHREELQIKAHAAFKDDPSSPRHEGLARRVVWIDELIAFADDVIPAMASWPASDDWGGWIARLRSFVPRVLRAPDRVLSTLDELQPLAGVPDVGLEEVLDVLRDRLTHLTVPPSPIRYGRVFIGTPDQLRGRTFDLVCVPGLSERVFPQRARQDPLLLDAERIAVSSWLAVDDDRVAVERLQLRLAAGAASAALVTSYASMDTAQARPRVPSFYAVDVQRAVTGEVPGYEALIRAAQLRSGARLAWPAPLVADTAIDAAEHDLSILQGYLRGDGKDLAGRARYLFDLNPSLRRALLARHHRFSRTWTPYDGLTIAPEHLAKHRLAARPYSASALQRFASCPYQFYLSTILRLEPREEAAPLTTLDPLTRGSMAHEMLASAMRAFMANEWLPLTVDRVAEAQALADTIVTQVAGEYADRLMPPILRVWEDAIAGIRRDIREWVRRLTEEKDGWQPTHVEIGVGFSGGFGRDEASRREDVALPGGTRLHGVVDLVEQRDAGEWRITDYKTGKYRLTERAVVNGGRTLQPILYAMAVEAAFGGKVAASRLYYCTEDGNYTEHDWPIAGASGVQTRDQGLQVLAVIDRAVAQGHLPAAPDRESCTWCDFKAVCGPGAQHVPGRKDVAPLADLIELRGWR